MNSQNKIVIDGTNATLGRLASFIAKKSLQGEEIVIVNSDKIIITGNSEDIIKKYRKKVKKGGSSQKGPKILRTPERILKRTIRGMLKHKKNRVKEGFKKIRCYNKVPKEYEEIKKISSGKEKRSNYITLAELSKNIK